MEFGWNFLWFIVAVSLLVTVHEFGHFWVARKLGFKVLRFSIGFGKPLYKRIGRGPDHTEYVIAALPLGGYVRMLDERDGAVDPADLPRAMGSKPPWQRILVMLAGPGANFLFAILVLWAMFWAIDSVQYKPVIQNVVLGSPAAAAGLRDGDEFRTINGERVVDRIDAALGLLDAISDDGNATIVVLGRDGSERSVTLAVPDPAARRKFTEPSQFNRSLGFDFWFPVIPPELGEVIAGGPADKAGLEPGDLIVAVNGVPMRSFLEFQDYIRARPDQSMLLVVRRDGQEFSRRVQTTRDVEQGKTIGRLHIRSPQDFERFIPAAMQVRTDFGPIGALGAATAKAWQMTAAQGKFFVRMLTGKISMKNLSSPIGIAGIAGDSAHAGPEGYLQFLVLISLSLGFLNLLPIPILDGGQVVFAVVEWLKGSPLSERAQAVGWHVGLLMLALLMGVAVFNDLSHGFVPS